MFTFGGIFVKKILWLFFVCVCAVAAMTVSVGAREFEISPTEETGTVSVEAAYGSSKRQALMAASAQVANGTDPDHLTYFAEGAKYRTVEDGYYTIAVSETNMCFNVDSDGANSDYEGIRITVWETTDDVTQRFRIVMNDDSTYSIYAACSHGGFNRAVGYNPKTDNVGLYSIDSPYSASFYIKNSANGTTKYIVLASDETKCLAFSYDYFCGAEVELVPIDSENMYCTWEFTTWGTSTSGAGETAMYPADILLVTQGPFDIYSHQNQNAADIQINDGTSAFAPFTCKVVEINETCGNTVWLQSLSQVRYADGSFDYMTVLFMHDNDITDIYLGQVLLQGQYFYEMGTAGYALGEHIHIACYRGEYDPATMKINNGEDTTPVNIWDAFFLPEGIPIRDDYGMPWVYKK